MSVRYRVEIFAPKMTSFKECYCKLEAGDDNTWRDIVKEALPHLNLVHKDERFVQCMRGLVHVDDGALDLNCRELNYGLAFYVDGHIIKITANEQKPSSVYNYTMQFKASFDEFLNVLPQVQNNAVVVNEGDQIVITNVWQQPNLVKGWMPWSLLQAPTEDVNINNDAGENPAQE